MSFQAWSHDREMFIGPHTRYTWGITNSLVSELEHLLRTIFEKIHERNATDYFSS